MKTLITVYHSDLKNIIFNAEGIKKLKAVSQVDWLEEGKDISSEDLRNMIGQYDACVTGWGSPKLTSEVLDKAARLKFIGHTAGTVVPYIDESAFDKNMVVVNANSALAHSTAEGTLALMMGAAWKLQNYSSNLKRGIWPDNNKETVMGLYGQVIGLIGYGEISRELIRLLKPFNSRILLCSNHCSKEEEALLGIEICGLEELLKQSDIVSIHSTLTPSTRGMIGKEQLNRMKKGALLVNTARGPIINEQALIDTLKSGRIYAAIDVFEREPVENENILLQLENVLCTPHIAGFSGYWKSRLGETVIDELIRWSKNQPVKFAITAEKYKRLTPG